MVQESWYDGDSSFFIHVFWFKDKKTNKKREGKVVQEIRKFLPFFTLQSLKK
jgi:hypothetical protein